MLHHTWFGAQIALAWFFAANCAVAVAMLLMRRVIVRSIRRAPYAVAPLSWRMLPAAVSVLLTCGLVIPAYAWLEPPNSGESIGWIARLLALGGLCLLMASAARGLLAVSQNARAFRSVVTSVAPLGNSRQGIPAFAVRASVPLMLLSGVLRPRLYVSEQVLRILSPEELDAAVAHELAHHRAGDNLKRTVLAFLPDVVGWTPIGRALEREWRECAEAEADGFAAAAGEARAVALAAALVKVARLKTQTQPLDFGCAAIDDGRSVAVRVACLLADRRDRRRGTGRTLRLLVTAATVVAAAGAWLGEAWLFTHRISEIAIRLP